MRYTKIVATVGPASSQPETIDALLAGGVDVFRLNFSHGTHESHAALYGVIREASRRAGRLVAVLQDLSGPKIRTGKTAGGGSLDLRAGQEIRLGIGTTLATEGHIFTSYAEIVRSARPGDRLLLDDGRIELRVEERTDTDLRTVVVTGGSLAQNKGINAPGVKLPVSAVTEKDVADLRFGLSLGVDLVALSFVQTADDVRRAQAAMAEAGRQVPLIAKIERPAALGNLHEILDAAEGVMVARGDLGLEMPLEDVPRAQKDIIQAARAHGRPVILATQVLESMCVSPRPTRAEVSDAAHAVEGGVDAIMLSGETAAGAHPVAAVTTLDAIVRAAEATPPAARVTPQIDARVPRHSRALCDAAVTLAQVAGADAIIAVTRQGKTARVLSSLRADLPIYAATPDVAVASPLTLLRGVVPIVTAERDPERLERLLVDGGIVPPQSIVVFVNVNPDLARADANYVNVQRLS